jgi:hypothetical protein
MVAPAAPAGAPRSGRGRSAGIDLAASRGAYGLALSGLEAADELLGPVLPGAPEVVVDVERTDLAPRETVSSEGRAQLALLHGGAFLLDRSRSSLRLLHPDPPPAQDLVHPFLAPAAAWWNQWLGRDCLHAGAFVLAGRAVVLLAAREGGKSTTLAVLAGDGHLVLADDLVVLDGDRVLTGPRSVDLRPGSIGAGDLTVREGSRSRLVLGPAPPSVPLAGFVLLQWGDRSGLVAVPPARRFGLLQGARMAGPRQHDRAALLRLVAAAGCWTWTRSRSDTGPTGSVRSLLEALQPVLGQGADKQG